VPAAAARPRGWTTPADVLGLLRKRWQAGLLLSAFASGQDWAPLGVPLRGPSAGELAERLGEVQAWAGRWEQADRKLIRLEYKKVGGRAIGSNHIPCRAWIDSFGQLWALLGVGRDVRRFAELADATGASCPRLVPWMTAHPMRVLGLAACWAELVGTVRWIADCQRRDMYLRQIDVPGSDTKFIEQHRGILADLLDLQLDGQLDPAIRRTDFAGRYGFRRKPEYVRFRLPGSAVSPGSGQFSELTVRTAELTAAPPEVTAVYVAENEITYLAFPVPEHAMVIFGGGYAVSALERLGWLAGTRLVYWGDIDTHGFAILNRLRRRFPHASSMLMDRATLLAHRSQWVTEPSPTDSALDLLEPDEASLYRDLADGTLGPSVRLEQERIRFSALEQALRRQDHTGMTGV
jgi:hypothetical protein